MGFIPGVSGFIFPLDLVFLKMNSAPKNKLPIAVHWLAGPKYTPSDKHLGDWEKTQVRLGTSTINSDSEGLG